MADEPIAGPTKAERKAAAKERAAKDRPMSVGNMEEVRRRRQAMIERGTSVVGQRRQDLARGAGLSTTPLPAEAVAAQMRNKAFARTAETIGREAGEDVVGDVLSMDNYDPNTAGLGQVYESGGRKWKQGKDGLEEIQISEGRAVAADEFVPANFEFATQAMEQTDRWIANAAAGGLSSSLIAEVAPLKEAYQSASRALTEARRNRDGRAIRDAEEDMQAAVDNWVDFANSGQFSAMAAEARAMEESAKREQQDAERAAKIEQFKDAQVKAYGDYERNIAGIEQQMAVVMDDMQNGIMEAQQAVIDAQTITIDEAAEGKSQGSAGHQYEIQAAERRLTELKRALRQRKDVLERQKQLAASRYYENQILGVTDIYTWATQVAPQYLAFNPNEFESEEEMLATAQNLRAQAVADISRVHDERIRLQEPVTIVRGLTINMGDLEYMMMQGGDWMQGITDPDLLAYAIEAGEITIPEGVEQAALENHPRKPEYIYSSMLNVRN